MIRNHIKDIRKSLGLTQKEFARKINEKQSRVSKWETQKEQPTLEKACSISYCLGIPIEDFIEYAPD